MDSVIRPAPFVLVSTGHGMMIVLRQDFRVVEEQGVSYGLGYQLFKNSVYDPEEVGLLLQLLELRRFHFGDGVIALDCGANFGVHTVEWARRMTGWGVVVSIEAQERVFYALAGNVTLNNCLNAKLLHAAVGGEEGVIEVPNPDYTVASSFGSFELRRREGTEFIGQTIDYENGPKTPVNLITIDSLEFERLDLIKMDIEGMEIEALSGAVETLKRFKPIIYVETLKEVPGSIEALLTGLGYRCYPMGANLLAVHPDDPSTTNITAMQA